MTKKTYLLMLLPLLAACKKEIDMDYRQVAPMYVVEAFINQDKTSVRISTTVDMSEQTGSRNAVDNAVVTLLSEGRELDRLTHTRNGYYASSWRGNAGTTYTMAVDIDGNRYTSTSTMQKKPQMNSFRFVWKDVLTERVLFAELKLQDIRETTNYYFMHIYRNNIGYRWAVMRDDMNPNGELEQLFNCTTKREMDKGTEDDLLREGDKIKVDIRAIDRRAYDYLYSMQVMDNTGSNPIANFTGGCLGYFSAYYGITYECIFHLDEVEEAD